MDHALNATLRREPWNKGKLVGQKAPLRLKDIWAIRIRLQLANRARELGVKANAAAAKHPPMQRSKDSLLVEDRMIFL